MHRYYAGFCRTPKGVRVVVEVPGHMGMRSWSTFTLEEPDDAPMGSPCAYVEEARMECTKGFEGTIRKEHARGHSLSHKAFVDALLGQAPAR